MSTPPPLKKFKDQKGSVQTDDLKVLESGLCSNVTFVVGESKEEVKAHTFKLLRSPVFQAMVVRWETGKDIQITIPEVGAEPFRQFLKVSSSSLSFSILVCVIEV